MEANTHDLKLPQGVAPVLGDYRLVHFINESPHMVMYHAEQQSVERNVVLQLLKPEACDDAALREEFKQLARAKAHLIHPNIAPVYELLHAGPILFYTGELLPGHNLDQLAAAGKTLDPEHVFEIMCVVGETMVTIKSQEITHRPLKGTDIHLNQEGLALIANLALPKGAPNASRNEGLGLEMFINTLAKITPKGEALQLIQELQKLSQKRALDWPGLLKKSRQAQEKHHIGQAHKFLRARHFATGWLKKKHLDRRLAITALAAGGLLTALALFFVFADPAPKPRDLSSMVRVGAGNVTTGQDTTYLSTFWIGKYEVTIAQYAEFLQAVAASGSSPYKHPDQPADKPSHEPERWAEMLSAAEQGKSFNGRPIDLNCPVTLADWWDAYAYASWAGLPTAAEWTKAAGGPAGLRYPWGNSPPAGRANLGADYSTDTGGGEVDGYVLWAPVDAHPEDQSPYGSTGMAGNVEEWTDTWANHPTYPDRTTPVVCGGSFVSPPGQDLSQTRLADSPGEHSLARGFRTASSTNPNEEG